MLDEQSLPSLNLRNILKNKLHNMTHWVTPEKEIQNPQTEEFAEKVDTPQEDVWVLKARHKEASDTLVVKQEELIKTNVKLAEKHPEEILEMETEMQNKVIKKIYGYDNLEELKLIQWDNFYQSDDEKEVSDTEDLKKQVKLMEYKNKKSELNRAMEDYKRDNKKIFEDNTDAEDKIQAELELISDKLSSKERIERAAKIVYGNNYVDNTTEAYLSMQEKSMSAGAQAQRVDTKNGSDFRSFAVEKGFLKNK